MNRTSAVSTSKRRYSSATTTSTTTPRGELQLLIAIGTSLVFVWIFNILLEPKIAYEMMTSSSSSSTLLALKQQYYYYSNNNNTQQQQQNIYKEEKVQQHDDADNNDNYNEDDDIHIVFSTGCSVFQDWQSYLLFYNVWRSGQKGHVTRIASGCKPDQEVTIQQLFQKEIIDSIPTGKNRFHLHLTPDYSRIHLMNVTDKTTIPKDYRGPYKFFNKPLGLRHWMEHSLGFGHEVTPTKFNNTMFIILDPDQIILHPFIRDYTNDPYFQLYVNKREQHSEKATNKKIRKGTPFSQLYLYGTAFINRVNKDINKVIQAAVTANTIDMQHISASNNGLLNWTETFVLYHYVAGPPYIAIGSDMYNIVSVWATIAVPVLELTWGHLSEMFAYSVAALYLQLPHQIATSFMISQQEINLEGWKAIDETGNDDNNQQYLQLTQPSYYLVNDNNINDDDDNNNQDSNQGQYQYQPQEYMKSLPQIIHYCQRYYIGPYFFSKYKFGEHNPLACETPLLLVPPSRIIKDATTGLMSIVTDRMNHTKKHCGKIAFRYNTSRTPDHNIQTYQLLEAKRLTFVICHLLYKLNDAVIFWKQQHCTGDEEQQAAVNYHKTFIFSDYSIVTTDMF